MNIGAPHGREASADRQITDAEGVAQYVRTVRAATDVPLIVKVPGQSSDIVGRRTQEERRADAERRLVLEAFADANGSPVRLPDGEFVDLPVAERARKILRQA